ncbi:MAG: glycosyltransferase family 2 protein [Candidatus Pacebacteria bacterium]|nr:glycosyltransferase family 2 protein [Candidatus Paceibacterota bacterium]
MNNIKPKVSVVIVTYNRPKFIPLAIQSILDQTYQDFEILVVDNGIDKPAKNIVENFNDSRIKYLPQIKNTGCSGGKNVGIKNAECEFVAFLDDDDVWLPKKLELQMNAFEKYPEAGFCFTAITEVRDEGEIHSQVPEGVDNYFEFALRKFNGFLSSTLIIKKEVFENVGFLSENFPSHTDIDLVIRITKEYKGIAINKPLIKMHLLSGHEQMGNNFGGGAKYEKRIKGRHMLLEKYKEDFKKRPLILSKHLMLLAKFYRNDGRYKEARKMFLKTFRTYFRPIIIIHYFSLLFNGLGYRLFKFIKKLF